MPEKPKHIYSFGPFRLNAADCVLLCHGQEIKLEPRAFDLLQFFAAHSGELVNREQLKLGVWGTSNLDDNNVDQKIAAVRRALFQNDGSREYIQNRRGRGWRFVADVTEQVEVQEASPTVVTTPAAPSGGHNAVPARSHTGLVAGIAAAAGLTAIAAVTMLAGRARRPRNFSPVRNIIASLQMESTRTVLWRAMGPTSTSPRKRLGRAAGPRLRYRSAAAMSCFPNFRPVRR